MKLIEWESLHNIGSKPEYGLKRSIINTAPLNDPTIKEQLEHLEDYEIISVVDGKIFLNRRLTKNG